MEAKLLSWDREFVLAFKLPAFKRLPEVAVWKSRIFVLEKPFSQVPSGPVEPVYIEAYPWSVDSSTGMWREGLANAPTE